LTNVYPNNKNNKNNKNNNKKKKNNKVKSKPLELRSRVKKVVSCNRPKPKRPLFCHHMQKKGPLFCHVYCTKYYLSTLRRKLLRNFLLRYVRIIMRGPVNRVRTIYLNNTSHQMHIGPCHVSGIPLQKGKNPFCKGEKPALPGWRGQPTTTMTFF
jgi:hypothetical protein